MIITKEDIKKEIGGEHCEGCPFFALDTYTTLELVQLGCKYEEVCAWLYGRALDKAAEKYSKLP